MYIYKILLLYPLLLHNVICAEDTLKPNYNIKTHQSPHKSSSIVSGAYLAYLAHASAETAKFVTQNQEIAANQASFSVKSNLAQTANGAAATAKAILLSKQIRVQDLKEELVKAQNELQLDITQYEQLQQAALKAKQSALQAKQQTETLESIVKLAHNIASYTTLATITLGNILSGQQKNIDRAKDLAEHLKQKIVEAAADLQLTEYVSNKAAEKAEFADSTEVALEEGNNFIKSHDGTVLTLKDDASVMETQSRNIVALQVPQRHDESADVQNVISLKSAINVGKFQGNLTEIAPNVA